ncbi:MAG: hypothetical protein ACPGWR_08350 [Ardenticatenaceae bacterium]
MLENGRPLSAPSQKEVQAKLLALIFGDCSREEVASWAESWIVQDDPEVGDPIVWRTLDRLSGADMIDFDRPYLYDETDFRHWLEELRSSQKLEKGVNGRTHDSHSRKIRPHITAAQPDLARVA